MALRPAFLLLILAVALATRASASLDWSIAHHEVDNTSSPTCDGLVGECIDQEEETAMESETTRRQLAGTIRYISYAALAKDRIPCNQRGQSYYNCNRLRKVNPYRRGCSYITHCARYLY